MRETIITLSQNTFWRLILHREIWRDVTRCMKFTWWNWRRSSSKSCSLSSTWSRPKWTRLSAILWLRSSETALWSAWLTSKWTTWLAAKCRLTISNSRLSCVCLSSWLSAVTFYCGLSTELRLTSWCAKLTGSSKWCWCLTTVSAKWSSWTANRIA